jgi:DNA polymerase-3 subunit beta
VSLARGEGEVEIGSGRGQFRVKTLATDDYPELPIDDREGLEEGVALEISQAELAVGLSQVIRSASPDESRQILTGVLWEVSPGELTLAATDSYRLAVRRFTTTSAQTVEPRKVVVPARGLSELARALQGGAAEVRTLVRDNLIVFFVRTQPEKGSGAEESVIGSRFIEGEFPNYKQLIPTGYENAVRVDREALLEVVRRVGLLAQNNMPVKLQLGKELEVSAHTPDVGEGQEIVDADYNGEPLVIAFNPQFLSEGAAAVESERLVIELADGLKPAVLHGDGDESFTYLLMPVRLS